MGPTRFSIQIFFHKWLREQWKKKNCSTYVLSETKLSNGRFMRLGQFYPMAHFSFVCKKNQTIKLEISFGCIQFWIDIEQ